MRHAFTLIELLVVLTVISLLASLLLPAIGMVRDAAKRTTCAQRMRMIGLGIQAQANDNDGQLVWAKLKGWPGSNGYFDPLISGGYIDGTNPQDAWSSVQGPAFNCPSGRIAQRGDFWYDYAPCVALLGTEEQGSGTPRRTYVAELTRAADVGLLFEVIIGTPWWIPANESPADIYSGWTAQHRSTANVVYADGHVSSLRYHGDVNQDGLATDATAWSAPVRNDPNDRTGDLIWSRAQLGLNPTK
jgi:prepilin-type N-terminal cleavage/methylation domain-containing protein/prepilin-type processing-associated H-X9-DG protein